MSRLKDHAGQRFGSLLVMERDLSSATGRASWVVRCDCGLFFSIKGYVLRRGQSACGQCLRRGLLRKGTEATKDGKTCARCLRRQDLSAFHKHKQASDGLYSYCRSCCAKDQRRIKYGLSEEAFEKLTSLLGGSCHACRADPGECVDHDHTTGRVRGWLCSPCNTALGLLKEDPSRIANLTLYAKSLCNEDSVEL